MRRRPRRSTLFPYTTLFRSVVWGEFETQLLAGQMKETLVGGGAEVLQIHRGDVGNETAAVEQLLEGAQKQLFNGSGDRKSTRLNSSHVRISYAVFCLKKKKD